MTSAIDRPSVSSRNACWGYQTNYGSYCQFARASGRAHETGRRQRRFARRLQGSHLANDEQAAAVTKLVDGGRVSPHLSSTFGFDDIPECHQLMLENKHPHGKMGGSRKRHAAWTRRRSLETAGGTRVI